MSEEFIKDYYAKNKLQQLRAFCFTVEEGSMLKAAKRLFSTQSNVSIQIKNLEESLGFELFIKVGRNISLTNQGRILYDYAKNAINAVDYVYLDLANNIKHKKRGEVVVSVHGVVDALLIGNAFISMKQIDNCIKFVTKDLDYLDSIDQLIKNKLDFAIYPLLEEELSILPSYIETIPFWKYKLTIFAHRDHPIAKKDSLDIKMEDFEKNVLYRNSLMHRKYPELLSSAFIVTTSAKTTYTSVMGIKGMVCLDERASNAIDYVAPDCDKKDIIKKDISHFIGDVKYYIMFNKNLKDSTSSYFIDTILSLAKKFH
jgi:DNA-binding transcriptional LysR family regulator